MHPPVNPLIVTAGRLLLALILAGSISSGAYVYGDIYKSDFGRVNKTLLTIEGPFTYQMVTDKANYSIYLPEGNYTIWAATYDDDGNRVLEATNPVCIGATDQKIDLVMLPVSSRFDWILPFVVLAIAIGAVGGSFWYLGRTKKPTEPQTPPPEHLDTRPPQTPEPVEEVVEASAPPTQHICTELDADALKVLESLERFEGRSTQKEIREALGFSDSKLSLILTELEQTGHIKKFKRGRGNIVKKL